MTRAALYELLTGHFADGRPVDSVSERTQLALSVTDHLGRLLNSRQGALRAAPDYGLPDTNLIYANQATAREHHRTNVQISVHHNAIVSFATRKCVVRFRWRYPEFEGQLTTCGTHHSHLRTGRGGRGGRM